MTVCMAGGWAGGAMLSVVTEASSLGDCGECCSGGREVRARGRHNAAYLPAHHTQHSQHV